VIHLIRASLRFCAWKDRRALTAALRPIYTATTVEAATDATDTFEIEWGDRYPGIVRTWRSAWEQFTPFLRFPPEIRKVVYTTDEIVNLEAGVFGVASERREPRRPAPPVRQGPSQRLVAA